MADVVINVGAVSAITAGTGLTGGTITGTGTIAADFGTTAGTICQGNDARLTAPVAPLAHASTHIAGASDQLTLSQSQITDLGTALAAKVATTRQVIAGTGLGGGGALSADVTLNVSYGSSGTTACVGNDARLSNARTPSLHASSHGDGQSDAITITQAQVTSLVSDLALKASTTHASTHATGGTDVLTLGQERITGLTASLAAKALGATTMTAGTGLTGGGDLSANRSFAVAYGSTSTTATVGNDSRLSFIASGTGATTRTLQNKLRDVVSVKDFGATGDGSTDDTAFIQAALDAAGTTDSSVNFPATSSFYKITDRLTIPNGVSVVGEGFGSLIKQVTLQKNIFDMGHDTVVENLNLEMPTNVASGANFATQNAIYASGKNNVIISANWIKLSRTECGVQINSCRDIKIKDNIVYGSTWDADPTTSSWGDIIVVGNDLTNTLGINRIIVENNFCLSNNCLGIWVDAYGGNADIIVNGNVSVTLDATTCTVGGTWSEASNGGVRRHAISVGYGDQTVDGPRAVVTNNVCRNTRLTGIYLQAGVAQVSGPIVCANNMVSKTSQATADSSGLTGGIWTNNQSPKSLITNNVIYKQTHPNSGGINYIATAPSALDGPTFSNNTIIESAGYGIMISSLAGKCVIKGNTISATTKNDIYYTATAANTSVGGLLIEDNVFKRTNFAAACLLLDQQSGEVMSYIRNNYFKGYDRTSGGSSSPSVTEVNAGMRVLRPLYNQIIGNIFENFHVAVGLYQYIAVTTRSFTINYSSNLIKDCNVGFGISSSATSSTVPICDNLFNNVTNKTSFTNGDGSPGGYKCGYIASKQGDRIVVYELNGIPGASTGQWAIGDRAEYTTPTAGGFLGAVCTTAGSPGTWKTFGAISA